MSGRFHSTHTPSRQRDILRRDSLGYIKRNDRAAESIHEAIYFSPWGKGFHKVTDPYSGEVFIVADGLGGATVAPGTPVTLASYGEQHGRVLIARPPSGMGGSGVVRTTAEPQTTLPPETPPPDPLPVDPEDVSYNPIGFCWDASNSQAIVARTRRSESEGSYAIQFVKAGRASIPYQDPRTFVSFSSIALTLGEYNAIRFYAMQIGQSSSFYVFYYVGEEGSIPGTTALMHLARISSAGAVLEHITYNFPAGSTNGSIGTAFISSSLYAIEYINGPSEGALKNNQRITKRNQSTLEVVAEVDVPDPTSMSFDPFWDLAGSAVRTIFSASGSLRVVTEYQQDITNDYVQAYSDHNLSLTSAGFPVVMDAGPDLIGQFNNTQVNPGGGIRFVNGGVLYSATLTGSSMAVVLATYDNDGQTSFFGIAAISSTEVVVIGTGFSFTLSILTSAGQQLP